MLQFDWYDSLNTEKSFYLCIKEQVLWSEEFWRKIMSMLETKIEKSWFGTNNLK